MDGRDMGKRLNWREACAILGCKKSHFYNLVNSGLLKSYKLPNSQRGLWVLESDCKKFVEGKMAREQF